MWEKGDRWLFAVTLASVTVTLVSIAVSEILLSAACVLWIVLRPRPVYVPRFFLPLGVFFALTLVALAMSPDPDIGMPPVRKFVLYSVAFLTVNVLTSTARARISYSVLLVVAAAGSILAAIQFGLAYAHFLDTRALADDPTVVARATGFMSHWMTFSGGQLLVWCAVLPVLAVLGTRWAVPLSIVGVGILVSFTRSVWLGAVAGSCVSMMTLPRRLLVKLLLPAMILGIAGSPLIYKRIGRTLDEGFGPDVGRIALMEAGVRMIYDHPLFGVGPERIPIEFPEYYDGEAIDTFYYGHMQNVFLQIAVERGLPTLAVFLWFLLELGWGLTRLVRHPDQTVRASAVAGLAVLTGILIAGLFENNFGDSEVLMLFLFLVSVPYGLARAVGRGRAEGVRAEPALRRSPPVPVS